MKHANCPFILSGVIAVVSDFHARKLGSLRAVRAHVQKVRSAHQLGCVLVGSGFAEAASCRREDFVEQTPVSDIQRDCVLFCRWRSRLFNISQMGKVWAYPKYHRLSRSVIWE